MSSLFRALLFTVLLPMLAFAAPLRPPQGGTGTALTPSKGNIITSDGTKYFGDNSYASVKAYGAIGNGVADDTVALQATLTASDTFLPPGNYRITAPLTIPSARKVFAAQGAVITLANNVNLPMFQLTDVADVLIDGLTLNGNYTNQSACNGICIGINIATSTRLTIQNTHIYNVKNIGIRVTGSLGTDISHNHIEDILGEGSYGSGIVFTGPAPNYWAVVSHNIVERTGGSGIGFGLGADAIITDNVLNDTAKNVSQQSVVLGYGLDNAIDTQRVLFANNEVNKSTTNGCLRMGGTDITVQGNTFNDCGSFALYALGAATTNTTTVYGVNLRFISNSLRMITDQDIGGIQIVRCNACEASGNRIILTPTNTVSNLIELTSASSGSITNNRLENGRNCIRITDDNNVEITGNLCRGQTTSGIALQSVNDEINIIGNSVIEMPAGATAGIDAQTGTPSHVNITGNIVRAVSFTSGNRVIQGPDSLGSASGNYAPDVNCTITVAANINPNGGQITCNWIRIIGAATSITSLTASPQGRVITLEFASAQTVVDGGNLRLSGNFVATADDTITLRSSGSDYVEIGRSIN